MRCPKCNKLHRSIRKAASCYRQSIELGIQDEMHHYLTVRFPYALKELDEVLKLGPVRATPFEPFKALPNGRT